MAFTSVLFLEDVGAADAPEPSYFRDLNLDQVVTAVSARETAYDLQHLFHRPLTSVEAIIYRQAVVRDLKRDPIMAIVRSFCDTMQAMREQLVQMDKLHFDLQRFRWLLHATETYCSAVLDLSTQLSSTDIDSPAFCGLQHFLATYVASSAFEKLLAESRRLSFALAEIQYSIVVQSDRVTVRPYEPQPDYSADIAATFEKFRQGGVNDYRTTFREPPYMNHVEEHMLGFVAQMHPEIFDSLRAFAANNAAFRDEVVMRFDFEVRFYIAYIDHTTALQDSGLAFCYPELAVDDKRIHATDSFDFALAQKVAAEGGVLVRNDFSLVGPERIFVVSGPNQGGKTTFARMFGQLHYLASLGLQVPGSSARLFLFDNIYTHFEREESIDTLRGKLLDDLVRIHSILDSATERSLLIINEIFSSTTLSDAIFLATKAMERVVALDALCVCVTFLADLSRLSDSIVSVVSEVVPEQPDTRTFRVVRALADGRSYAQSIAEKYRLTYDALKERIQR